MRFPILLSALALALGCGCAGLETAKNLRTPPQFVLTWGKKGTNNSEFLSPIGIAIGPRDEIFVAEFNGDRVQRFNSNGDFLGKFPAIKNPGGVAVDRLGRCYVSSMTQHKVAIYDATGKLREEWGTTRGSADDQFNQPGGIVVARDGSILVADQGNHRILRFSPEGKLLAKIGRHGNEPGCFGGADKPGSRFGGPQFLALDRQGNIYTTEAAAGRIQKLDPHGQPLLAWGDNSVGPGGFGGRSKEIRNPLPGPIAVWVDRRGRVWVSATNDRVQIFTQDGNYLLGMGGANEHLPGQFHLPHGMATDSQGCLYVVDASNQRIQKFKP